MGQALEGGWVRLWKVGEPGEQGRFSGYWLFHPVPVPSSILPFRWFALFLPTELCVPHCLYSLSCVCSTVCIH